MASNRDVGIIGEQEAIKYLIRMGYKIIEKNFRTKKREIDIIAMDNDILSFIEVKTRKTDKFGLPCESVNLKKQHTISLVSMIYMAKKGIINRPCRFDVVEVYIDGDSVKEIRLIKDAFQLRGRF